MSGAAPSPEVLAPAPGSRWRLFAVLLGLGGLLAVPVLWLEPWFFAQLHNLPACERLRWMQVALQSLLLVALLPAPLLWWYAGRVSRAGRFPLTARWLLRSTPVSRGPAVGWLVWSLRGLSVLLLLGWLATQLLLWFQAPFSAPMQQLRCAETDA